MLLVLVVGCRQRTFDCTLAEADAVMEHNADSAYTLLQQIPDAATSGNEATRARYTLLLTQATYKLYRPVPPDSLIQSAVAYYEQAADRPMLARAYYYRAMTLYERSRHDEAIVLLKQGEQIVRELNDLLQLSKYHESLCMVNDRAKCNDLMLHYAKQFLDDALQLRDSVLIARGLCHTSTAYARLGNQQQDREFILKTLPLLQQLNSTGRAYILTNIACMFHEQGDAQAAKRYLLQSLSEYPKGNTFAELGDIYAEEGDFTEAMNCWNKALQAKEHYVVVNTLNSIYKHYKQKNDLPNALATLEQIHHLKDSVNRASEKAEVAEIQLKYDKQVVENRYYKVLTWTFAGASFLLLVILLILFYHRHVVKVYTNNITKHLQTIQSIQQQIDQLEQEKQQQAEDSEKISERYDKKIVALQKKMSEKRRELFDRIGQGKNIYERAMKGEPFRYRDDEICLIDYFSVAHHDRYDQWMHNYQDLSPRLLLLLILQDAGKSDTEIEKILSINHTSFRSTKSRLNAKLKPSTQLQSVANEALKTAIK